jgi:hypothetical protein
MQVSVGVDRCRYVQVRQVFLKGPCDVVEVRLNDKTYLYYVFFQFLLNRNRIRSLFWALSN